MSISTPHHINTFEIENARWQIDPGRSSVEFRVPNLYGLQTVKGRFERYEGTLDLHTEPAIELTIDADSVNTNNAQRDKHLRSAATSKTTRRSGSYPTAPSLTASG